MIADTKPSCDVELFDSFGELVHFGMNHSRGRFRDANCPDEKRARHYFGEFVQTASIPSLFILNLFVAECE